MKNILNVGIGVVVLLSMASCQTKWNYVDTGLTNGRFDGNMYEYLQSNHYDWDSTLILIDNASLAGLFEGKDPEYKEITFLGPTNHSIRRWMMKNKISSLKTLGQDQCRKIILRHVIKGKLMCKDIPSGKAGTNEQVVGEGGQIYVSTGGAKLWLYTFQEDYEGVPGTGAINIYLRSVDYARDIDVASSDIEPDNGVVHSLGYGYTLEEL